ncbi:ketoacyl-synthetase C-terminal extension domain-containing protein [Mycobacterium basiliense]|uniref:ketoacyl-synthetase C-terminal extension domain-containing protein n=1 Tax=Mycobacterium basiliense TaxID=2094119 RepID=UPI001E3CDA39|nr:ketoacyl-synthetase C-terminal extension domain-containing protein [Mycobacterium basiliense]
MSSFGISGTNAHIILEEPTTTTQTPPTTEQPTPNKSALLPWVLSAKSAAALTHQAQRLVNF